MPRPYHVLFLCTRNSARSIMAESILNALGGGRFRAFSAGSHPAGRVNAFAVELLARSGYETRGLRSKSWHEHAAMNAAPIDFVITLCDVMAGGSCPVFPGRPVLAHWSIPDPAAVEGSEAQLRDAFAATLGALRRRVQELTSLPFDSVDRAVLGPVVQEIGAR